MRRRAPRPLGIAAHAAAARAAPATRLARVQGCWPAVAGPVVAGEAEPSTERDGVLTIACASAVWAQELDLLSADLLERLNAALAGSPGEAPLTGLRFVAARPRERL